jgi:hypothetical protein
MSGAPGRFQLLAQRIADEPRAPRGEEAAFELAFELAWSDLAGGEPPHAGEPPGAVADGGALPLLQQRARIALLSPDELAAYWEGMDRFAREVLAEQNRGIPAGQTPRQLARVARTVGVELAWPGETHSVITLDLGAGGFCAVLASAPPFDEPLRAQLRLRRDERVYGSVRVAGVRRRRGSARVSFAFSELAEADRRLLERYVVDELLAHFRYRGGASGGPARAWRPTGSAE